MKAQRDILLTFDNALRYNYPGDECYVAADLLRTMFVKNMIELGTKAGLKEIAVPQVSVQSLKMGARLLGVYRAIELDPYSPPFHEEIPADAFPDYHVKIKEPMWLKKLQVRLNREERVGKKKNHEKKEES